MLAGVCLHHHSETDDETIMDVGNPLLHLNLVKEVVSNLSGCKPLASASLFVLFRSRGGKTGYAINFAAGCLPGAVPLIKGVDRQSSGKRLL